MFCHLLRGTLFTSILHYPLRNRERAERNGYRQAKLKIPVCTVLYLSCEPLLARGHNSSQAALVGSVQLKDITCINGIYKLHELESEIIKMSHFDVIQ